MDNANSKPNEWWELVEAQFQEEMQKNLVAHKKDEATYRRHIIAFKKAILDFIYQSLDSIGLFSPLHEEEETKYSEVIKDLQQE